MIKENKYAGDVVLVMTGKKYVLRYDWEAIGKLVTVLGKDFEQEMGRAAVEMDLPVIAKALSIGLLCHQPGELTDLDIMEMSPPLVAVHDAINRAITLAFHGTTEVPVDENPPRAARVLRWLTTPLRKIKRPRTATA